MLKRGLQMPSPARVTRFVIARELLVIPIRPMRPYLPPVAEAYAPRLKLQKGHDFEALLY